MKKGWEEQCDVIRTSDFVYDEGFRKFEISCWCVRLRPCIADNICKWSECLKKYLDFEAFELIQLYFLLLGVLRDEKPDETNSTAPTTGIKHNRKWK